MNTKKDIGCRFCRSCVLWDQSGNGIEWCDGFQLSETWERCPHPKHKVQRNRQIKRETNERAMHAVPR